MRCCDRIISGFEVKDLTHSSLPCVSCSSARSSEWSTRAVLLSRHYVVAAAYSLEESHNPRRKRKARKRKIKESKALIKFSSKFGLSRVAVRLPSSTILQVPSVFVVEKTKTGKLESYSRQIPEDFFFVQALLVEGCNC
jgi:hypothetical protein